ncbi:hypothetical protein COT20_01815 [bacterium (Candidatus Gribaldobacteria) CG08_land_8_20_14_0_20_39_15]|uniref:ATP-grasp domain-containing protein n=1 Tax=bacterium (Candidatus Gribaldobacteria) CG08_land_8_20_14_0_20_39_15 TaxID=2014273 RepID=A0A2M6XUK1_9BACT|nr:MAG: hypothetical protein COT20_01815 [bacterium (Candidatus Gribaldobacteria) CG08_land_8_20_14_0_20_39_15]
MQKIIFEENHIHSNYSDGQYPIKEILEYNNLHDKLDLIIADHVDKKTSWFGDYVREIEKYRKLHSDFSVRIGCEVKIMNRTGALNTTDEILNRAEIVVGAVHHFAGIKSMELLECLDCEYELTKIAANNKKIHILAHPFSMSKRLYEVDPPIEYVKEIYNLCVKNGIKFEYALKYGSKNTETFIAGEIKKGNISNFSFGSDVHNDLSEIGDSAFSIVNPITVLVTGGGAGVGQSIIKALKLSKVRTRIIVVDNSPLSAGVYRGNAAYLVPLSKEKSYVKAIVDIISKENVDLVLIGTDVELPILAENKEKIESLTGAKIVVSDYQTIAIANDKWKTVQFLKEKGFAYPNSCLKNGIEDFFKKNKGPFIVKPRIGARSVGVSVVHTKKELLEKIKTIPNPIIQEYLQQENEEYTCAVFFYEGKDYGAITMKRWLRNGDTYRAVISHNPELEKFVIEVGKQLKIYGPCNFQLRRDGDTFKIFEINCRFSGTTGARSFLGFNVINMLLQKEFFARSLKKLTFKHGYMFRYWNELFVDMEMFDKLKQKGYLKDPHSGINIF